MKNIRIFAGLLFALQACACWAYAQQADQLSLEDKHEVGLDTKIPPRLSPDGKWIACIRQHEDRSFSYYLVRSDGKTELRLHDLPANTQADMAMLFMTEGMWSPDGKKILVAVPEKDGDKIGIADGGIEHGLSLAVCDVSGLIDGKKTEPVTTLIARADGVPFGGVFGKDGKVYWSSVNGLGALKTTAEIRVYDPADSKDKKFVDLPEFGVIYLTASPDRTMIGGLTMAQRTQPDEEGLASSPYERRLWVCRLTDGKTDFTGPRTTARSAIIIGRKTFWSDDGKFFYAVSSSGGDGGQATGLFVLEPFPKKEVADVTQKQLERFKILIDQLGSKEWQKRESAYAELQQNAETAKKLLEEAAQSPDPEIAERAKVLLMSQIGVRKIAPTLAYEAAGLLAPGIISAASPEGAAIFIDADREKIIHFKNADSLYLIDRQGDVGLFVDLNGQYCTARIRVSRAATATQPASQPAVKHLTPV